MRVRRRGGGLWRERAVLAGGLFSAAALLAAALVTRTDAGVLGEATVARAAAEVADGVAGAWARLERSGELLAGPANECFRWTASDLAIEPAPARELVRAAGREHAAFDLLLGEAARREAAGDKHAARELVDDALALPHDPPRAAEALLASVRLAAAAGDGAGAVAAWRRIDAELSGLDARGEVAFVLLGALSALPALAEPERAQVTQRIADLWARDELALPCREAESVEALAQGPDPLRAALLAELEQAAGSLPDGIPRAEERRRTRALAALCGTLPAPAADELAVVALGNRLLLCAAEHQGWRARVAPRAAVEDALVQACTELVPAGFRIDFGAETRGTPVGARTELAGDALSFVLRHDDPRSLAAGEASRQAMLRAGLVITAALVAAASVFAWRALGRERRLAELRSAFVAGVSHELRTPVASILLMAENLESGRASPEARPRYHSLIRREAQRLRRLVDDVLDFSRLERGEGPELRAEDLDLAQLLAAVAGEARERAEASGASFSFRSNGIPDRLHADGEALRRALLNLVDNALKHSGSAEVELTAAKEHGEHHERDELVLAVRDHGRGVPAERMEEVFEPFARLAEGPGAASGAGLGLALVRAIAAAHGGRALARAPEAGPGVVFELRIPIGPLGPLARDAHGREAQEASA